MDQQKMSTEGGQGGQGAHSGGGGGGQDDSIHVRIPRTLAPQVAETLERNTAIRNQLSDQIDTLRGDTGAATTRR